MQLQGGECVRHRQRSERTEVPASRMTMTYSVFGRSVRAGARTGTGTVEQETRVARAWIDLEWDRAIREAEMQMHELHVSRVLHEFCALRDAR